MICLKSWCGICILFRWYTFFRYRWFVPRLGRIAYESGDDEFWLFLVSCVLVWSSPRLWSCHDFTNVLAFGLVCGTLDFIFNISCRKNHVSGVCVFQCLALLSACLWLCPLLSSLASSSVLFLDLRFFSYRYYQSSYFSLSICLRILSALPLPCNTQFLWHRLNQGPKSPEYVRVVG